MGQFKRSLSEIQVVAFAIAMMGPTAIAASIPPLVVQLAGNAAPLSFLFGTVALAIVGSSFVSFSRRIATTGSAAAFVGDVFGARAGFLSGWCLLFAYVAFVPAVSALFGHELALSLHLPADHVLIWLPLALLGTLLAAAAALRDIRVATSLMLILESLSMMVIFLLSLLIFFKSPPMAFTFTPSPSVGWHGVGAGVVLAITSLGGFEGAATLGKEARSPFKAIPLAIFSSILIGGLFYTFVTEAEIAGYGAGHLHELGAADSALAQLGLRLVGHDADRVLNLAVALSWFSMLLGVSAAAARVLHTLAEQARMPALARLSLEHSTPDRAIYLVSVTGVIALLACFRCSVDTILAAASTMVGLSLTLVYMAVTAASGVYAARQRRPLAFLIGASGFLLLVFPFWNSVYPVPPWPAKLWPYATLAWLGGGILLTCIWRQRLGTILFDRASRPSMHDGTFATRQPSR